jgi:hypothetical protein
LLIFFKWRLFFFSEWMWLLLENVMGKYRRQIVLFSRELPTVRERMKDAQNMVEVLEQELGSAVIKLADGDDDENGETVGEDDGNEEHTDDVVVSGQRRTKARLKNAHTTLKVCPS